MAADKTTEQIIDACIVGCRYKVVPRGDGEPEGIWMAYTLGPQYTSGCQLVNIRDQSGRLRHVRVGNFNVVDRRDLAGEARSFNFSRCV